MQDIDEQRNPACGNAGFIRIWISFFFCNCNTLILITAMIVSACGCKYEKDVAATKSPAEAITEEKDWTTQVQLLRDKQADSIEISASPITDAQFEDVSGLMQLRRLSLDQGIITDHSLPTLGTLQKIVLIKLRNSPLTDAAAPIFRELESLQFLNVPQAQFTAKGLQSLAGHPKLRQLRIGGKQIDDEACSYFAQLPELRFLHLIGPQISQSGIDYLAKIEKLQSLYIDDCSAPDEAWEMFFKARPDVHVHLDQHHLDRDPAKHAHPEK